MRKTMFVCLLLFAAFFGRGEIPVPVSELLDEMQETGASVRSGVSPELGVFIVGIGRARFRANAVSRSRDVAQLHAVREITSALQSSFKARDVAVLGFSQCSESAEARAFVTSITESSIDQLVKGVQVVSERQNSNGEIEVAVYTTSKARDQSCMLGKAQLKWGDRGVVAAVGVDIDRAVAEKNALRSAVEQIAGTLVIGKVAVNEKEELHKRLATTAGALVEEYRITNETKVKAEFRVEVLARVNKRKLYDSYRSYFKCLDDPLFCITATDASLIRQFEPFFVEKGFRLTNKPDKCHYLIKLDGAFKDRPTPGNARSMGTMLSLNIKIVSADGTKDLLAMNEQQAKDSEILTREQRAEEVARRIFHKLEARLHEAIQNMVVRMLDESWTAAM